MVKSTVFVCVFMALAALSPAQAGCVQLGGNDPCNDTSAREVIVTTIPEINFQPGTIKSPRQIGSAMFNRDIDGGPWTVQRFGDNAVVKDANGSSKRCNQFGDQLVCY